MAHKQLLLSFLVNILGEFVDGLNEENLKVGVWGGKIKLTNLQINKTGLEKMNLPLTVKEGYLDTLEVKIPWTNLDKQAVQITITGVHLLVGPVDFSVLTVDRAAARCRNKRKEHLEKAERVIEFSAANHLDTDSSNTDDMVKNASYKRKLMRKMIKNLEVSFRDVHIRYEDCSTLLHENFNFGMTVDSIVFKSSNEREDNSSATETKGPDGILSQMSYKLVTFINFAVYWNIETSAADSESTLSVKSCNRKDWTYIIHPINELHAKIALNYAKNAVPQTSVSIDDVNISLHLDKYQLHQALVVQKYVMKANAKLFIVQHRPRQSALEKPIYWWKYIIILLTNNANIFTKKIDMAMLCCQQRKRYIEIIVKGKTFDMKTGKLCDVSPQEETEVDIIEELLPMDALVIFRQIATKEALLRNQQNQKDRQIPKKRVSKKFSIFGGFKKKSSAPSSSASSSSDTTSVGDAGSETTDECDEGSTTTSSNSADQSEEIEQLEGALKEMILSSDTIDNSLFTLDIFAHINISLALSSNWTPLATTTSRFDLDTRIRPTTNSTSIRFVEFVVIDRYTTNPLCPHLLEFDAQHSNLDEQRIQENSVVPILLCYDKHDNSSGKLSLTVQPVLLHFNIICVYALSDIFKVRHLDLSWGSALDDFKRLLNVHDVSNTDKTLIVHLEVLSPLVLIPADSSVDKGYLRLEMGDMVISGQETSNNCVETHDDLMSGKVSFENISVEFVQPGGAKGHMYIIKPLNFVLLFETLENSAGETFSVDVVISPNIEVVLDLQNVPRIMGIIDLLSRSEVPGKGKMRQRTLSKIATLLTSVTDSSSKAVNEALTKIHSKIRTNASTCLLKCTGLIPALSVAIIYDTVAQHKFILDVDHLTCSMELNLFDFQISFDVDECCVQDTYRIKENQKYIIHPKKNTINTEESEERKSQNKFLHVVYSQYLDKKSPAYTECGAGVSVAFGDSCLNIDASMFGRISDILKAFRNRNRDDDVSSLEESLLRERRQRSLSYADKDKESESESGVSAGCTTMAVPVPVPSDVSVPTGINLSFKVSEISILLNRDSTSFAGGETSLAPGKELESTILCHIQDITSEVKIRTRDYIFADLHFGSVGISDNREITRDFCYSEILYPLMLSEKDAAERNFPSDSINNSDESHDSNSNSNDATQDGEGGVKKAYHLSINYVQDNAHSRNVELIARSVTIFLSFDIILEAISVISEHVDAIKSMKTCPETVSDALVALRAASTHHEEVEEGEEEGGEEEEKKKEKEDEEEGGSIADTFCLRLFIPNPQFIFLENPTEANSKAVVCRSRTDLNFRQDITACSDPETLESIHVSLSNMEFFVLLDMLEWLPHQLVQPVTVELHVSTAVTRTVMTQATMSLHVGHVNAKFSLNDLILLQSIWMRRGLVSESVFVNKHDLSSTSTDFSFINKDGESSQMVFHNMFVNIETMSVMVINDFDGCSIPLLKLTLDQTSCKVEGFHQDLRGTGSLILSVNSYNANIREWEPILEAWSPELNIMSSTSDGTSINLTSENHVQFNLTSDFLELLLQTVSLLHTFRDGTERELPPAVKFENKLGRSVTLLDGHTKKMLFHLHHNDMANIFVGQQSSGYHFMSSEKSLLNMVVQALPETIDLYFDDVEKGLGDNDICSLVHLPLHVINYTHMYPMKHINTSNKSGSSGTSSDQNTVKEEIYEYQRYNPLLLSWVDPFLTNDPHRWSDVSGIVHKFGKNSVKLPVERGWSWNEDWKIDVSSQLGVQIDSEGFHYGFDFYGICGKPATLNLRTFRPLDCVRRRRWVRRRSLKQAKSEDMHIFWEVKLEKNGSKVVTIRSALRIINSLPYDVSAHLDNGTVVGPIPQNSTFNVPLAEAKGVKRLALKPSFLPSNLTTQINCSERSSDFLSIYNVRSTLQSDEKSYLALNTLVRQKDKSIHVTVFPHASIFNALPCSVKFKFTNSSGIVVDQDFLDSADSRKLCFLSLKETNFVSLQLSSADDDNNNWSPIRQLNKQRDSNLSIPLYAKGKLILKIHMKVKYLNTNISKIEIYTKSAFVDYSRLNIALSSSINDGGAEAVPIIRTSYTPSDMDSTHLFEPPTADRTDVCDTPDSVDISHFFVRSRRRKQYRIIPHVSVGDVVHTDRELRFLFLPKVFQNQTYITTACEDRTILIDDKKTHSFINFSVLCKSMVFIMIEKTSSVPFWMKNSKFIRVLDQVVARGECNGYKQEIHYSLFGKIFEAGSIHLGSNVSKDASGMYGIFILSAEITRHRYLLDQLTISCADMNETSSENWCRGGQGMTLFNTDQDNKVRLGVQELNDDSDSAGSAGSSQDPIWSQTEVDLGKTITATKIPFEVINNTTSMSYQLVYRIESLPGVFHRMKILEVMPRFLVVNATDELLYLRQEVSAGGVSKADDISEIQPYCMKGWHKRNATGVTSLQVRFPTTQWCHGAFDINEIGSSEILLPKNKHIRTTSTDNQDSLAVVNVEVKLADADDKCFVYVLFWKSEDATKSPLAVSNNSAYMISISQADAYVSGGGGSGNGGGNKGTNESEEASETFQLKIPPQRSIPYGWANPNFDCRREIFISIGDSLNSEIGKTAKVNVLDLHQNTDLYLLQMNDEPVATVSIELQSTGRIIKINDCSGLAEKKSITATAETEKSWVLSINLAMTSIGLSLVAGLPHKRELISFHIDDFLLTQTHLVSASTVELTIGNVQIDNYSETAVYPVLFRRDDESFSINNGTGAKSPFIQAAVLKESVNGTHKITYFSLRVLKFVVELDSGSIYILFSDLFSGIDFVSTDKLKAFSHPVSWMSDYNSKLLSSGRYELTDIDRLLQNSHQSRTLFENIIIHPIQGYLTFVHTERVLREDATYSSSSSYVDLLASIGAVDLMVIRLNSFIVSNAIESFDSLQARIWAKVKRDVKMQLAQIAGSLTILGSPVGLVRNVGGGVKSFFYEPAVGLVQSPMSFLLGIHKGTSGLVSGVLSGTLNTTAALVGTASSGISFLSGDREYMQKRSLKMKKQQAARGGAISGLMDGGIAAFTGIASGVTGVVLKPMEGAQREGPLGFIAGVGKGIAGVAVKPVLGVTDGLTSIVQGISNEVGQSYGHHHVRPARAFQRLPTNVKARLLTPISINDAYAQECVVQHSKATCMEDEFISQITMGKNNASQIIFSDKCVWWKNKKKNNILLWDDISYVLKKPGQLEINPSAGSSIPVYIDVSATYANQVYSLFLSFADKMTNPSVMRNALYREMAHDRQHRPRRRSSNATTNNTATAALITYEFGSHNYDHYDLEHRKEGDLIVQTRAKLLMAPVINLLGVAAVASSDQETGDDTRGTGDELFEYIDVTVSWLIRQWDLNHSLEGQGRTLSYCCVSLIINASSHPVEIMDTEIIAGRAMWSLGSEGSYCAVRCNGDDDDDDARKLIPAGGYVLLLACGNTPSFFHSGNIELMIQTSAFDVLVTNNEDKTTFVVKKNPFHTEFIEKTHTDSWSKYVLFIT